MSLAMTMIVADADTAVPATMPGSGAKLPRPATTQSDIASYDPRQRSILTTPSSQSPPPQPLVRNYSSHTSTPHDCSSSENGEHGCLDDSGDSDGGRSLNSDENPLKLREAAKRAAGAPTKVPIFFKPGPGVKIRTILGILLDKQALINSVHKQPPKNALTRNMAPIWDGITMVVWLKCDPGNYNITGTNTLVYL